MTSSTGGAEGNIAYLRLMLGELRVLAMDEGAEVLSFLIEMAYVEAGDLQAGGRRAEHESPPVTFEPDGRR